MRKIAIMLGMAVLGLAVVAGWQVGSCELASIELQDDMQDLASQAGTHIGLAKLSSDDDLRSAVVGKAREHGINLQPAQIRVQRAGSGDAATVYLRADYTVPVNLPGWTFALHFTSSSRR